MKYQLCQEALLAAQRKAEEEVAGLWFRADGMGPGSGQRDPYLHACLHTYILETDVCVYIYIYIDLLHIS